MIIVMRPDATDEAVAEVTDVLADAGLEAQVTRDETQHVVMAGSGASSDIVARLVALGSVARLVRTDGPGRLVSKAYSSKSTVIDVSSAAWRQPSG